ncbi:MAG: hypothetical protein RLN66_07440 [Roseitalea porphyridii]
MDEQMHDIKRRIFLASLTSSVMLAASPASALVCNVSRSRNGDFDAKTYDCRLPGGRSLRASFVRMSDVIGDTLGRRSGVDDADAVMGGARLIENTIAGTLADLFDRFSFAFEANNLAVEFDGRSGGGLVGSSDSKLPADGRLRTLGVWDHYRSGSSEFPVFPLPDELRRAFSLPFGAVPKSFLRYATTSDFADLEAKMAEYERLITSPDPQFLAAMYTEAPFLRDNLENHHVIGFGNIELMAHIEAGRVDRFLPILFASAGQFGCAYQSFGPEYVQPKLYVDAAVFTNTGSNPIEIDDAFGAADATQHLRAYSPQTPPGEDRLGWGRMDLGPGESVVAIQRLIFGADDFYDYDWRNQVTTSSARAVYGPTQLPKGIVVDGTAFPFEGRSHNVLLLSALVEEGSCPFLYSWCEIAREWVSLGKVLTAFTSAELQGEQAKRFDGFRSRFRLIEREHERTWVCSISLDVELADGSTCSLDPEILTGDGSAQWPVRMELGHVLDFVFHLPEHVAAEDVTGTVLRMSGYYERYTAEDMAERNARGLEAARVRAPVANAVV